MWIEIGITVLIWAAFCYGVITLLNLWHKKRQLKKYNPLNDLGIPIKEKEKDWGYTPNSYKINS